MPDYAALAAKYGGKVASAPASTPNYDALAQQLGGTAEAMPQTESTPSPAPTGVLERAPSRGLTGLLSDAESDLLHGGSRTMLGRALGYLEGQGDKGYQGLEYGTSPGVAQFMGSPILGPLQFAKGQVEGYTGHPLKGLGDSLAGALKAIQIPSSFIAPEAGATGEEIRSVLGIPNEAHAGRLFQEVGEAAKNVPVTMEKTEPELNRFAELTQRGGRNSKVMTQLAKRIARAKSAESGAASLPIEPASGIPENPDAIKFPEARDFYHQLGEATHQTPLEKLMGRGMKPVMRRQAILAQKGLGEDISNAAAKVGKAQQYSQAMNEYRRAKRLSNALKIAGLGAAGEAARRTGLLGAIAHKITLGQ